MHAGKIVKRILGGCLSGLHAKQSVSILAAVTSVLRGGNLTLSQLARSLESAVSMRHRIKRMDRLLGSWPVHQHRIPIYRALSTHWLEGMSTLLIVVDWSDMTEDQRWGWVGRIRNRDMICLSEATWQRATDLYAKAVAQPQAFEGVRYVRNHPTACRLVLIKKEAKGRIRHTRLGAQSRAHTPLKAEKREREPWLLACSPSLSHLSLAAVAALYAQRMRIEQSFRDTKNCKTACNSFQIPGVNSVQ